MLIEDTLSVTARRFYQLGGNLPADAPSYVRRAADVDLVRQLMEGHFCYVLTSRQMGKSSLMVQTAKKLREEGVKVAVLDLTRIGQNLTPEQWYDGLLIPLGREFHLEYQLDDFWNSSDPAIAKLGPMQRWITAVREVVLRSIESRIVIFVDEIDAVRGLPFSTDEFFAGIRQMYNQRTVDPELERITFCLLGVAKPSDLIRNVNTTPFNVGHRIELTDFREEEAQPLLGGLGRDEEVGRRLLRRILWWTGGHPYLTQRLCVKVAADPSVADDAGVDHVCRETFLTSRAREKDDNLLFVRERLLRSEVDRASLLDLYAQVRSGKKVADDDASALIDTLRLSGLVAVSGNALVVRNRIYRHVFDEHWIRQNMPDAELRRQKRAFLRGVGWAAAISAVVMSAVGGLAWKVLKERQETQSITYADGVTQAQQDFDAGNFGAGIEHLDVVMKDVEQQKEPLGFGGNFLWARSGGGSATAYLGHWDDVRSVTFSQDGLLATGGADSTVRIFDTQRPCAEAARYKVSGPPVPVNPNPPNSVPCFHIKDALFFGGDTPVDLRNTSNAGIVAWIKKDMMISGNAGLLDRSGRPRSGTLPSVLAARFSPDGKWLAVATGFWHSPQPGKLYLWRIADGKMDEVPNHEAGAINQLAFSSQGELAALGNDGSVEFFSPAADGSWSENLKKRYVPPADLQSPAHEGEGAAFSTNGQYFVGTYGDGHIVVKNMWAAVAGSDIIVDVSGMVSVTFFDEKTALMGSKDGIIWQLDCATMKFRQVVDSGQGLLPSLAIWMDHSNNAARDRGLLVSAGTDATVKVWRLQRDYGEIEAWNPKLLDGHRAKVFESSIASDGSMIVTGGVDGTVRFWEYQPSADAGADAHSDDDTRLRQCSLAEAAGPGRDLCQGVTPGYASQAITLNAEGVVRAVAFSPDAHRLVYIRGEVKDDQEEGKDQNRENAWEKRCHPAQIYFYDLQGKSQPNPKSVTAHCGFGTALAYSPDGRYVATGAEDGGLWLWDTSHIEKPAQKLLIGNHTGEPIAGVAFSKEGALLAATTVHSILLWKRSPGGAGGDAYQRIATPGAGAEAGKPVVGRGPLAFSPDGKLLGVCTATKSSSAQYTVQVLDAQHPEGWATPVKNLTGMEAKTDGSSAEGPLQGTCTAVAFSPDQKRIAAGTFAREVVVWEIPWFGGEWERMSPSPHQASSFVQTVAFSPDGSLLAYGSSDAKIMLWNIRDGFQRPTLRVHKGGVWSIAFSPNGNCMASASADGTLRLTPTADPPPNHPEEWVPFGSHWRSCADH